AIAEDEIQSARHVLREGAEVGQMMKVVGEEGTSLDDFLLYLKSNFLDSVYLQQNGFDKVDAATSTDRQQYVFAKVTEVLDKKFVFDDKKPMRDFFYKLRHAFIDWNYKEWQSEEFKKHEKEIDELIASSEVVKQA
ncbi:MAG: V-type ATP synthase subunit A, partial [Candidatus Omnitrophica bacterium]|nr:V-type ATP synthase subunit A [Candidatus Omnitrophota bacterium]